MIFWFVDVTIYYTLIMKVSQRLSGVSYSSHWTYYMFFIIEADDSVVHMISG